MAIQQRSNELKNGNALEVNGEYLLGIIAMEDHIGLADLQAKYALDKIDPTAWYPAQNVIAFYREIEQDPAGMFDLVNLGISIVEHLQYPRWVKTVDQAAAIAQEMHREGWRGGTPGTLQTEKIADQHLRFTFEESPLPVDLVYGLCYGMVKRFNPANPNIVVERVQQGSTYIFDMRW